MRPPYGLHMWSSTRRIIIVLAFFFVSLNPRPNFAESSAKGQECTVSIQKFEISSKRSSSSHVFKESIARLSSRKDLTKGSRQIRDYVHEVVFVVRQKNMDELTRVLIEVSDPRSSSYGQHLKREEVIKMTSNLEGRNAIVDYLESNYASIVSETQGSEYITASAPIFVWEKVFKTEFFQFNEASGSDRTKTVVRAESYSVPQELNLYIESVFNVVDIPCRSCGHSYTSVVELGDTAGEPKLVSGYVTPALLNRYYNMGSSGGSAKSTQAFYDTGSQYFSPADLLRFEKYFNLPNHAVVESIGGRSSDSPDKNYYEGNLDAQYITSTSPNSPTTVWYTAGKFSSWLVQVGNASKPPMVLSISYGQDEDYVDNGIHSAFNTEAIKLGAMGVTIVASSGDDGVSNRFARGGSLGRCSYSPDFPASSPFVTAVGATSVRILTCSCFVIAYLAHGIRITHHK
jgi:tripeptidyl-peptidase I